MAEKKEIKFKAKNGKVLIARDEIQAAAFEKQGLVQIEGKTTAKDE